MSPVGTKDAARLDAARAGISAAWLFAGSAATLFVLLFLRRTDALMNPQFFAEDGRLFFHDQMVYGAGEAIRTPYAGYLLVLQRLVAWVASYIRPSLAPAVYNVAALGLAALCCAGFALPVFRAVIRSDALRFCAACLFAVALDSAELVGTLTQVQWFLQIGGILLLLGRLMARRDASVPAQAAEAVLLVLIALSCPLMVLAVPLAIWLILQRRSIVPCLLFLGAVAVQLVVYKHSGLARGQAAIFQPHDLVRSVVVYFATRPVLSSIVGRPLAMKLCGWNTGISAAAAGIPTAAGLFFLWKKSGRGERVRLLVCLYLAAASLALGIGARNLPRAETRITFGGERYFYLAACCFVVLVAMGMEKWRRKVPAWSNAAILLAVFAGGAWGNFRVPAYPDMHWALYQDEILDWWEDMHVGNPVHAMSIPINPPGWNIILDGNTVSNLREPLPLPWLAFGAAGLSRDGALHGNVKSVFRVLGPHAGVEESVAGLIPDRQYRVAAAVWTACAVKGDPVLSVEDGRGQELAEAHPTRGTCDVWQNLELRFHVPESRRALIKLGNADGQLSDWDDLAFEGNHGS